MRTLAFVIGVVIVLGTWGGLVATFVVPRGRSLMQRLPSLVIFSVYRLFVAASHLLRSYDDKDGLLAAAGAISLIVQLVGFLAALLIGFALALVPWAHGFATAVRDAASALFVVGLPNVERTNAYLAVAAAASGAVTIALQIGYLPVIYDAFSRREALVTLMESRAGVPAWGPEVLIRHELVSSRDALGAFYRDWERWCADVAESHGTYPVLHLFRSSEAGYSWVLSLLAVLDAAALQLSLAPAAAPSEARMVLRMGFTALRRLARTLGWRYDPDPKPEDEIELTFSEFAHAVAQLREVGFPVERELEEAWTQFRGWRVNYESLAYRFADFLVTPHAPWSGSRRHLSLAVVPPHRPPHRSPGGAIADPHRFRPRP